MHRVLAIMNLICAIDYGLLLMRHKGFLGGFRFNVWVSLGFKQLGMKLNNDNVYLSSCLVRESGRD